MRRVITVLSLTLLTSVVQAQTNAQIEANKGVLKLSPTAALPSPCRQGQLWFDSTTTSVKLCADGTSWTAVGGSSGITPGTTTTTAAAGTVFYSDGALVQALQMQALLAGNQCTSAVGTDAYACSPPSPQACTGVTLANAPAVFLTTDVANTGGATFAYCGLTAKAIVRPFGTASLALVTGDMLAATSYLLQYNATGDNWKVLSATSANNVILNTLSVSDGAVGAPAIFPASSTNSGLFFTAGGVLNCSVAGVNVCIINGTNSAWTLNLIPLSDNAKDVGASGLSWRTGWFGTSLISPLLIGISTTGTDVAGGNVLVSPGTGTGAGAGAKGVVRRNLVLGTGTTTQSQADAFVSCESKILSNTSATATTLATIAVATTKGGGAQWTTTISAESTEVDAEIQTCNATWVNKAGTVTVSTPVCTATSAVGTSGSTTVGSTIVASGTNVLIKATPVFTTIVPTTVTSFINISNNGHGSVTCS